MIEVGQTIAVRQPSEDHRAQVVSIPSRDVRRMIDAGTVEREAVLFCALGCPEFNQIYIPFGQGGFELVWYSRPEITTIHACVRWPVPAGLGEMMQQRGTDNQLTERAIPPGISAVGVTVSCTRSENIVGLLGVDALSVYMRMVNGMTEEGAISVVLHENCQNIIAPIQEQHRNFVIVEYRREWEVGISTYIVTYGWTAPDRYAPEPDRGNIVLRSQLFADEFLTQALRIGSNDIRELRDRCMAFCRDHDPDFIAPVDFFRRLDVLSWECIYSIRQPAILRDAPDLTEIAHAERELRAERYRYDTVAEMEEEDRRRRVQAELDAIYAAGLAKAKAHDAERVAKQKQVKENKTGLRSSRPNIISEDDSED